LVVKHSIIEFFLENNQNKKSNETRWISTLNLNQLDPPPHPPTSG